MGVKVIAMDRQRVDLNGVPPPQGEIHVFRGLNCALAVFRNYPLLSLGNRIPDVVARLPISSEHALRVPRRFP